VKDGRSPGRLSGVGHPNVESPESMHKRRYRRIHIPRAVYGSVVNGPMVK
jgi:hypothetical protein